jgi:tRNA/rRNA methyltransferase
VAQEGVAFLFGSERFGMRNEDVYRSHACLSIPTAPDYGSLNIAAAVQLIAYDWREALGGHAVAAGAAYGHGPDSARLADAAQVAAMLAHLEGALVDIGFLNPAAPKKLMPRLNQLFNRAQVTQEEIHILRGIARAMAASAKGAEPPASAGQDG